jgi:hypothetical protein
MVNNLEDGILWSQMFWYTLKNGYREPQGVGLVVEACGLGDYHPLRSQVWDFLGVNSPLDFWGYGVQVRGLLCMGGFKLRRALPYRGSSSRKRKRKRNGYGASWGISLKEFLQARNFGGGVLRFWMPFSTSGYNAWLTAKEEISSKFGKESL